MQNTVIVDDAVKLLFTATINTWKEKTGNQIPCIPEVKFSQLCETDYIRPDE